MTIPEAEGAGEEARPSQPWWEVALIGVVVLGLGGAVWFWATSASEGDRPRTHVAQAGSRLSGPDATRLAGVQTCRECHPGEHAAHAASGHSRTLRRAADSPAARQLDGKVVADPEKPGISWTYALRDGRFTVQRSGDDDGGTMLVDFALGSGKHATTFVTLSPGPSGEQSGLEHRLSYYAKGDSAALTPGQHEFSKAGQSPYGYVLPPGQLLDCFDCHSTITSSQGRGTLDAATMVPNVSCERCHGPGRAHVEAARRGASGEALAMPLGTSREQTGAQVAFCGGCHRLPQKLSPEDIRPDNPALARFPSVGLVQSKCSVASRGALVCTTCHDPHGRASKDAAGYEAACLSCHQKAPQRTCSVSPTTGCVGCHMPGRDAGHGLTFTDHWIRKEPGGSR